MLNGPRKVGFFFLGDDMADKEQPKQEQYTEARQQQARPKPDTKKNRKNGGHTIPVQMI